MSEAIQEAAEKAADDYLGDDCPYWVHSDILVAAVVAAVRPLILEEAATAIEAHADKHAPADGNFAQLRLRRHLHIAARVVGLLDPPSTAEVAAAVVRSLQGEGNQT